MRAGMVASIALVVVPLSLSIAGAQTKPSSSLQLGPPPPVDLLHRQGASNAATTMPAPIPKSNQPTVEAGLTEFLSTRFRAHEPIYFLYGCLEPNSKFQISLKYQLFGDGGDIDRIVPWASNLYIAYSQTSFWDLGDNSSPFFDSSYRPELLYQLSPRRVSWLPGMTRFDFQTGLKHESNGKSGLDSRTMNTAYLAPIFTFGDDALDEADPHEFFVSFSPRVWMYLTEMTDNPDIYHYRGYGELRLVSGWRGGFQAAFMARAGNSWDKGALEVDLSYPLQKLAIRDLGMYLHAQLFTGYGETLLDYNESRTTFRVGLSLVR